jgi:putative DNA primase/helicase
LHIPTRTLQPPTPDLFTLNALTFAYNPDAPRPERWLRFCDQLWPDESEPIATLQEFIGYLLTAHTRYQKILMLVGPKRSGKGTIGRVIRQLLGAGNVCSPTLSTIGGNFGRTGLIGKTAAIIADARISGRTDTAAVTECLLSISGEDPQSVPRKFLPDWDGTLGVRFVLMTNELPKIEDASGALASRFLIIPLTESWFGREDVTLYDAFHSELPGIFNWALDGWSRLAARGKFQQPSTGTQMMRDFEDLGSPIGAFIRDECEVGAGYSISQPALFQAWKDWGKENGRDHPGTIQMLGRNLGAQIPWLGQSRPYVLGKRVRFWDGLRLKIDDGTDEDGR